MQIMPMHQLHRVGWRKQEEPLQLQAQLTLDLIEFPSPFPSLLI